MIPPLGMGNEGGLSGGDLGSVRGGARKKGREDPAKAIAEIAARLSTEDQASLLKFARFLEQESPAPAPEPVPEPEPIPRPESESVIKAMRRLSATYPMLDRSKLLNETSALMGQHVMQGRPAVEVIDELEVVFRTHYEKAVVQDPTRQTDADHDEAPGGASQ
ncbi:MULTISPECIES: hypothetical protein [Thioalkalivibrio]|uniref:hypothetical protein n=1 Tax=Thioalkalivibrio TaxID=106633 RepID=UPI00036E228D|nr:MULTISPECIES: hypothetical protein [Thioalkalivibrio]OOC49017.1 hypothetical protein B0684_07105 [Thioalkalivibrio versutus]